MTNKYLGFLSENSRSNHIENNSAVGVVVGVIGSGGSLPTRWSVNTSRGLATEVIATGSEAGMPYVDIKVSGTPSSSGFYELSFETSNQRIAALPAQTWAISSYLKTIAGDFSNISSLGFGVIEFDSGGGYEAGGGVSLNIDDRLDDNLMRFVLSRANAGVATAFIKPIFGINVTNGNAVDITIRFAGSQAEIGSFATSLIFTDNNGAETRSRDIAGVDLTNAPWFNPVEGTLLVKFKRNDEMEVYSAAMHVDADNNTDAIRIGQSSEGSDRLFIGQVLIGGVQEVSMSDISDNMNREAFCALAYKQDDFAFCVNGGEVQTVNSGDLPTALSNLRIGANSSDSFYGTILYAEYIPERLSNSTIQELTENDTYIDFVVNGELDDCVPYIRLSEATYYNESGDLQTAAENVPRNNYLQDGSGENGLLLERAATNLCLQSEVFSDNTYWLAGTNSTITDNAGVAPDGSNTADRFTSDTNVGAQRREQTIAVTASTEKTFSVWIKEGTQNTGQCRIIASGSATHELLITPTANWERYELVVPSSDTATNVVFRIYSSTTGGALGDNILVWGAQVEESSFATSYIPTTSSAATRAADIIDEDLANVYWFNSVQGTLFTEHIFNNIITGSQQNIMSFNDGTNNNAITIAKSGLSETVLAYMNASGVGQAPMTFGAAAAGVKYKQAYAYKLNDVAGCLNGGTVETDDTATIPTVTKFQLGLSPFGVHANAVIKNAKFYQTRLANTKLQGITS